MQPAQPNHAAQNGNRQAPIRVEPEPDELDQDVDQDEDPDGDARYWTILRNEDGTLDFDQLSGARYDRLWRHIHGKVERGEPLSDVEQQVKDYWDNEPPGETDLIFAEAEEAGLRNLLWRWCTCYCPEMPPSGRVEVPNSILVHPGLGADEKVYLAILLGHKGAKGIIPGEELLAWYMDRTPREIRRLNSDLVKKGLLKVERRYGHSNAYKVTPPRATSKREQGYTCVPRIVAYDRMLEAGERLAFMIVAHFQRQDEWCLHPVTEMARLARVDRTTFQRWMEMLYRDRLILESHDRLRFGGAIARCTGDVERARDLVCRELATGAAVWQTRYVFFDGPMPPIQMQLSEEVGQPSRFWVEPDPEVHKGFLRCREKCRRLNEGLFGGTAEEEAAEVLAEAEDILRG